jgi:hypothetical protein
MIPPVVASERGRAQTEGACSFGVVGLHLESIVKLNCMERQAIAGESTVSSNQYGRAVS